MHGTGTRATLARSSLMEQRLPTSRQAWLAVLLIPAVVVGGLTGAVVANAESVSQVRVAQADYAGAWGNRRV